MRLVTAFADASTVRNGERFRAGWAAWAKCDLGTLRYSGEVKGRVIDNTHAETAALANAVFISIKGFHLMPGDRVLAQSDCLHAIRLLGRQQVPRKDRKAEVEIVKETLDLLAKTGVSLAVRHVKGHRGTEDRRAAINTWCDSEARRISGAQGRK